MPEGLPSRGLIQAETEEMRKHNERLKSINFMKVRIILFLVFLFFPVCVSRLDAVDSPSVKIDFNGAVDSEGIPSPWELKVKKGDAGAKVVQDEGEPVLHMKSLKSSFSLAHGLNLNVKEYPYITWTWKALTLPLKGDVRKGSKNDQALQILVGFEGKKILSYVWDSNAPEGTVTEESVPWPVSLKIKVIVVKSGASDTGKWLTITRNIYEDYRKFFNEEPLSAEGIRVQTNTQHTDGSAEGFVKRIVFSKSRL